MVLGISQHKLFQTAQLVNTKIVKSLQIAVKFDNAQINYDKLSQDAILFKRAALGILEELRSLFLPVKLTLDDPEQVVASKTLDQPHSSVLDEEEPTELEQPGLEPVTNIISTQKEMSEVSRPRSFFWESSEPPSGFRRFLSKRKARREACFPDAPADVSLLKQFEGQGSDSHVSKAHTKMPAQPDDQTWYISAEVPVVFDTTHPAGRRDSPTLGAWEKWRQSDHLATSHATITHTRSSSEYSYQDRASIEYSLHSPSSPMRHPAMEAQLLEEEEEDDLDDNLDDDLEDDLEDDTELSMPSVNMASSKTTKPAVSRGSHKKLQNFFGEEPPENRGFHKKKLQNFFGEDFPELEHWHKSESVSSLDESLTSMSRTSSRTNTSTPMTSPASLADSCEWEDSEGMIPKAPIYELYAPPTPSSPPIIPARSPLRANTCHQLSLTTAVAAPSVTSNPMQHQWNPSSSSSSSILSAVSSPAPSTVASSTSSRIVSVDPSMSRVPPSKANNYHGFCKDAWVMRKSIDEGLKIQSRPSGIYSKSSFFQCRSCSFQSPQLPPKSAAIDQKVYASAGILYRWSFLAKSHVKCKSGHERSYGCMFCTAEGAPGQIHGAVDTLMGHIVTEHSAYMSSEVQKETNCVFGRIAQAHEDFDICVPVNLSRGPVFTPIAEELEAS